MAARGVREAAVGDALAVAAHVVDPAWEGERRQRRARRVLDVQRGVEPSNRPIMPGPRTVEEAETENDASDSRVAGTVAAIERELSVGDGLIRRYSDDAQGAVDGITGGEGALLACSFWLVDNLALLGRIDEARQLFGRLVSLSNDVGFLSQEYDPTVGRQTGNFPQALSHIALVNSAVLLSRVRGTRPHRGRS
jgi:hypothetical protein